MIWFAALLVAASPAPPVAYLACELDPSGRRLPVDVAVDEANQQVTIALPSGRSVTRRAIFSPTLVTVPDDGDTWSINRVTLAFQRKFGFRPPEDDGESGACRLKPPPQKRAF